MRIVAGKYKGRTLMAFDGDKIRPTSDKARESLFNILQSRIIESDFLDLCCGTGAMGIEALSRGAKKVVFNDISKESLALLKKNIDKIKVDDNYEIKNFDAITYLKSSAEKFDIIYIDPPYKFDKKHEILNNCHLKLNQDGLVVFEDENEWQGQVLGLTEFDKRKYGRVHLTFFRKED